MWNLLSSSFDLALFLILILGYTSNNIMLANKGVSLENDFYPFYGEYGSEIVIYCSTHHDSNGSAHLRFYRNLGSGKYEKIENKNGVYVLKNFRKRALLKIQNVTMNDSGLYHCADDLKHEKSFVLKILKIKVRRKMEPSKMVLICTLLGFNENPPSLQVEWFYRGTRLKKLNLQHTSNLATADTSNGLKDGLRYQFKLTDVQSTLSLSNPDVNDFGPYTCAFHLPTNKGSFVISADSYDNVATSSPQPTNGDHYPYYAEGTDLVFPCSGSANDHFSFYWLRTGGRILLSANEERVLITTCIEENTNLLSKRLTKKNLVLTDTGQYECSTDDKKQTYVISVTVLKSTKRDIVYPQDNSSMLLICDLDGFGANPPSSIVASWFLNDSLIFKMVPNGNQTKVKGSHQFKFDGITMSMNLTKLADKESFGVYKCSFTVPSSKGSVHIWDEFNITDIPITKLPKGQWTDQKLVLIVVFLAIFPASIATLLVLFLCKKCSKPLSFPDMPLFGRKSQS
ncbi:hypothetical protein HELRODRAFT_178849 [Helobdella robusta]|uniref:Ig-like domain-containing protein n=1 Tax=Helobdella robusta TaxID=6412 RepID=T1FDT6_HELRO|nr:hypothetical protein HELRODRAFT_178849 [Helobdella robusta]ESN95933.1 hypothetical protein HELRODRAFT_178849 [Helobdella robusta]